MIITTRFTTGTYIARAKGLNVTASCAESARRAAENLARKLGHNPDLLGGVSTFSLPEVADA